jgi:hypothetical protein
VESSGRAQHQELVGAEEIEAPDEHAAGLVDDGRIARGEYRRRNLVVQLLQITVSMRVEDHEIRRHPAPSPVAVCGEELAQRW